MMRKSLKSNLAVLFIIASCVELALGILKECNYELPGTRFILWGTLFVYLLMMCCNRYTKKELLLFAVFTSIGMVLYVSSGINTGIKAPIYILALKGVDCKKLYRIITFTLAILLVGIVGLYFVNIFVFGDGISDYRLKSVYNGYSFGFCNPNRFQVEMFSLMVFSLLQWNDRLKVPVRILGGVLYFTTCILSDCNTGILVGGFVFILFWLLRYIKCEKWRNLLTIGVALSLIVMIAISVVGATGYRGTVIEIIDKFISGRIGQLSEYNNEPFHLTGEIYNWRLFSTTLHKNVYDLGYVQLFYYYGYVPAVCYLFFVGYSIYVAWRNNKVLEILALWGFAIYLFMEAAYFSNYLQRDFLLMMAAYIVMWKGTDDEKKIVQGDI
jgi:hypothetical protein